MHFLCQIKSRTSTAWAHWNTECVYMYFTNLEIVGFSQPWEREITKTRFRLISAEEPWFCSLVAFFYTRFLTGILHVCGCGSEGRAATNRQVDGSPCSLHIKVDYNYNYIWGKIMHQSCSQWLFHWCVSVIVLDEQVAHCIGSLCHLCMNVCMKALQVVNKTTKPLYKCSPSTIYKEPAQVCFSSLWGKKERIL